MLTSSGHRPPVKADVRAQRSWTPKLVTEHATCDLANKRVLLGLHPPLSFPLNFLESQVLRPVTSRPWKGSESRLDAILRPKQLKGHMLVGQA